MRQRSIDWTYTGYLAGFLICVLLFMWESHVIYPLSLGFWQWCVFTAAWGLAALIVKPLSYVGGIALATTILAQALAWLGVITLPLIKIGGGL